MKIFIKILVILVGLASLIFLIYYYLFLNFYVKDYGGNPNTDPSFLAPGDSFNFSLRYNYYSSELKFKIYPVTINGTEINWLESIRYVEGEEEGKPRIVGEYVNPIGGAKTGRVKTYQSPERPTDFAARISNNPSLVNTILKLDVYRRIRDIEFLTFGDSTPELIGQLSFKVLSKESSILAQDALNKDKDKMKFISRICIGLLITSYLIYSFMDY